MATQPETIDHILHALGGSKRFSTRKMFGEYALYADGITVALVCDDQLYVKIRPETEALADRCDQDVPYPGGKPHYVVEESMIASMEDLPDMLFTLARSLKIAKRPVRKTTQARKATKTSRS